MSRGTVALGAAGVLAVISIAVVAAAVIVGTERAPWAGNETQAAVLLAWGSLALAGALSAVAGDGGDDETDTARGEHAHSADVRPATVKARRRLERAAHTLETVVARSFGEGELARARYEDAIARARAQGEALTERAAALERTPGTGPERKTTRAALHALAAALEASAAEIAASGVGSKAPGEGEIAETVRRLENLAGRSPRYAQASQSGQ